MKGVEVEWGIDVPLTWLSSIAGIGCPSTCGAVSWSKFVKDKDYINSGIQILKKTETCLKTDGQTDTRNDVDR